MPLGPLEAVVETRWAVKPPRGYLPGELPLGGVKTLRLQDADWGQEVKA